MREERVTNKQLVIEEKEQHSMLKKDTSVEDIEKEIFKDEGKLSTNVFSESFFVDDPSSRLREYEYTKPTKQRMFRNPFSFKGRIRRLEYGLSYLLVYILFLPMNLIPEEDISFGMAIFYLIVFIPTCWFLLAQGAKRCHDRNNSGWYQLIPFYYLWMLFGDGDGRVNDYGSDPKGRNFYV